MFAAAKLTAVETWVVRSRQFNSEHFIYKCCDALASQLAMYTSIPSTAPVDVMIAMAAKCHLASAKHIVPVTIQYMEPFFKQDDRVEAYVEEAVRKEELQRKEEIIIQAEKESGRLAQQSSLITSPFGDAVAGGSSEGVGSPTNCGRLAHYLARRRFRKYVLSYALSCLPAAGLMFPVY